MEGARKMEKKFAITILEEIYSSLQDYNWKEKRIENNKDLSKEFRNINK